MPESRRPDEVLFEELTDQVERTRRLLMGSPDEAAALALARIGREHDFEARVALQLAAPGPLAQPARFGEAHRLALRALEILDREGSRNPRVGRLGPLKPFAAIAVEFVAEYIVKSYAAGVAGRLRTLYTRREAQCPPEAPERRVLARARMEMDRVTPGYSGGGIGAPVLVAAGAAIPAVASGAQWAGAVPIGNHGVQAVGLGILFVVFFALSWVLLRGAAVAHQRSRFIMGQPLAALWETIGHAGNPPEDDSVLFATIALVLTAVLWFALPLGAVLAFVVFG